MIWLPTSLIWMNLDHVRHATLTKSANGNPIIYVVFGSKSTDYVAISDPGDINILNDALNARCAEEAGEAFLP
jgi:hypothetical protein